jgi:hypothetical protein
MEHCSKCGGTRVKVSATTVRRFFMIRCLRRGCGTTTVRDLSISGALAGVLVKPHRTPGTTKNHAGRMRFPDGDDF